MTNSTNPNRGHCNPAPVITHPKTPATNRTTAQDDKPAAAGKGGRS